MRNSILFIFITALTIWCIFFIFKQEPSISAPSSSKVLRIGILPTKNKTQLLQQYQPLFNYLSQRIGMKISTSIPNNYQELLDMFNQDKIDLAYFGGITFVQAHQAHHAYPLVMRDTDTRFTSWFITQKQNIKKPFSYFKNKKIAFGNPLSTSGYIMPYYYLQQQKQIIPEQFFSHIEYSPHHNATINKVLHNEVDIGVINPNVLKQMLHTGKLQKDMLHIVWETPPYVNYVWAVQEYLDEVIKIKLLNAFLELDMNKPVHQLILKNISANAFFPVDIHDFRDLKNILKDVYNNNLNKYDKK